MTRETRAINRQVEQANAGIRQTKSLAAALSRARRRAEAAPSSGAAWLTVGDLELQAGHIVDAARDLHTAATVDPRSPLPLISLARLYDRLDMPDLAVSEYRSALRLAPRNDDAILGLAYKYITFGWNVTATRFLNQQVRNQQANHQKVSPRIHAALALAAFQTADFKDAERELLAAHLEDPTNATLTEPLVEVYRRSGRLEQALKFARGLPRPGPDSIIGLLEMAQIYLDMGKPALALGAANEALSFQRSSAQALYDRAIAERNLGRSADSERDLEAVLRASPGTGQTRFLLGRLYIRKGLVKKGNALLAENARAEQDSERLDKLTMDVAYHPDRSTDHLAMGKMLESTRNYPRAIVEFKRALELDPSSLSARASLIRDLRAVGRIDEANKISRRARYSDLTRLVD